MSKIIHTFYDSGVKIQYSILENKAFEMLEPTKVDINIYFKKYLFEKLSHNKFYSYLKNYIVDNSKYAIEIGNELYIIELFKEDNFNFYIQNGRYNENKTKEIIGQFYGYFIGYIEGYQTGYNIAYNLGTIM